MFKPYLILQGCFFHGCTVCFDSHIVNPLNGTLMGSLNRKTKETTEKLRLQGYTVIEKWEHEFVKEKKEDRELGSFISTHTVQERLNPRDSFFGGRTNAIQLYYEGVAKYVDFTSLYPWVSCIILKTRFFNTEWKILFLCLCLLLQVNKYCDYPVGHPIIITENFKDVDAYFGILKCRVLPPKKLYFPVLPYRANGKLMFPLCRTCVENLQQNECQHTNEQRELIGTWVSEELKMAVKKGYIILEVSLLKIFINLFYLKIKISC